MFRFEEITGVRLVSRQGTEVVAAIVDAGSCEIVVTLQHVFAIHGDVLDSLTVNFADKDHTLVPIVEAIGLCPRHALHHLSLVSTDELAPNEVGDVAKRGLLDRLCEHAPNLRRLELTGNYFFQGISHASLQELTLIGLPLTDKALMDSKFLDVPSLTSLRIELFADDSGAAHSADALGALGSDQMPAIRRLSLTGQLDGNIVYAQISEVTKRLDRLTLDNIDPNEVLDHIDAFRHLILDIGTVQRWIDCDFIAREQAEHLVERLNASFPKLIVPTHEEPLSDDGLIDPRYQGSAWDVWLYESDVDVFNKRLAQTHVTHVSASPYDISGAAMAAIAKAIGHKESVESLSLDIRSRQHETGGIFETLESSFVRSFELKTNTEFLNKAGALGELCKSLPRWPLESFSLRCNGLGDTKVKHLIDALCQHESLRDLSLGLVGMGEQSCRSLGKLMREGKLRRLAVHENPIGAHIAHFVECLPLLSEVRIGAVEWTGDALQTFTQILAQCDDLRVLNMQGISYVSPLATNLDASQATAIASAVGASHLRNLDLSVNKIGSASEDIAIAAVQSETITSLNLSETGLTPDEARTVIQRLGAGSLSEVSLGSLALGGCCKALGLLVADSPDLRSLSLNMSDLDPEDEGWSKFSEGLRANRTLSHLDLDFAVPLKHMKSVLVALQGHPVIRSLSFRVDGWRQGESTKAAALIESLAKLEELSLDGCAIRAKGAASLAGAIGKSNSLKRLRLRETSIGDKGLSSLLEAAAESPVINYLDFRDNHPGKIMSKMMRALKKSHPSLVVLSDEFEG